jgi:hypothetical protein
VAVALIALPGSPIAVFTSSKSTLTSASKRMMSLLPSIALRQLHLDHRRGGVGGFDQDRRPCGFGCSRSDAQPSVSFRMFTAQAIA